MQQDSAVWRTMQARLRADPWLADKPAHEPNFRIRETRPSILPGTRYYWGIYFSPTISHARITVVAAKQGRNLTLVERQEDWSQIRNLSGWEPRDGAEAIRACAELIFLTRWGRSPFETMRLFVSERSAEEIIIIGKEEIAEFARPPQAVRSATGWEVSLTMIEPGVTVRYLCELQGRSRSSYVPVDSIGWGFAR